MKTILFICAIAAFATALPSDDVETDLLTPANEVDELVPETDFVQAAVGYWQKCTMGPKDPDCGKKNGEYTTAQKNYKWVGAFNLGVSPSSRHGPRPKLCSSLTQEDKRQICRCKGKDYAASGSKPCFARPSWTPAYKMMAACGPNGYAWSTTCSNPKGYVEPIPAPKPTPKRCKCTVTRGKYGGHKVSTKSAHTEFGGKWSKSWMSHNQGFRKISCTGCEYVVLEDDDASPWKHNHVMHCCGKKKCKHTLPYDLKDDIKAVHMGKAC